MTTVLTDSRIDPDRLMLANVDTELIDPKTGLPTGPIFTVSEMSSFFFGKSNHWVRWLESLSEMEEDPDRPGKYRPVPGTKGMPFWFTDPATGERRRVGQRRNEKSARAYTLADVEEVAHALAQNSRISGTQLRHTLLLVQVSAELRGLL